MDSFSCSATATGRRDAGLAASGEEPAAQHLYLDRELSQLAFNERVLALAADRACPLLERMRFLCIVAGNLDEFFEVRLAAVRRSKTGDARGRIARATHRLAAQQYRVLEDELLPALAAERIRVIDRDGLDPRHAAWAREYFLREVMPLLSPITLDSAHPFPRVVNKSCNIVIELAGRDAFGRGATVAIVNGADAETQIVRVPGAGRDAEHTCVTLAQLVRHHAGELFPGLRVAGAHPFRVTRDSEMVVDGMQASDLVDAVSDELPQRAYGAAVRLQVARGCPQPVIEMLLRECGLAADDVYRADGPLDLACLAPVAEIDRPSLKFVPHRRGVPSSLDRTHDIFATLRERDVLLHHPYESFDPVLEFLDQASRDPAVLAIRQTVYRTGSESQLMERLMTAARNGKDVTVVVELLARFDEQANIRWADRLREAGVHVVYGVLGYKVHAKMLLIVRREREGLRRYVHLSTGNYNARTTRLYTDLGLLTCNSEIAQDVNGVFLQLTGLGHARALTHLWQSPFSLHAQVLAAIEREAGHARAGRGGRIVAKMNALLDPAVIDALYAASRAGVRIDLVVRGACALRPGVPGLSERIRVRSVIGRFLEHTRVFCFGDGGAQRVYLASADWMGRNFFGRVEVCFPVLDPVLRQRVIDEALQPYLDDNTDAWDMDGDGRYRRAVPGAAKPVSAQRELLTRLCAASSTVESSRPGLQD
jgi:polyphosphate kinase